MTGEMGRREWRVVERAREGEGDRVERTEGKGVRLCSCMLCCYLSFSSPFVFRFSCAFPPSSCFLVSACIDGSACVVFWCHVSSCMCVSWVLCVSYVLCASSARLVSSSLCVSSPCVIRLHSFLIRACFIGVAWDFAAAGRSRRRARRFNSTRRLRCPRSLSRAGVQRMDVAAN
eukprot:1079039-Pleurochrysis_carterae.AAC.1